MLLLSLALSGHIQTAAFNAGTANQIITGSDLIFSPTNGIGSEAL
jgi:hypothetical protein